MREAQLAPVSAYAATYTALGIVKGRSMFNERLSHTTATGVTRQERGGLTTESALNGSAKAALQPRFPYDTLLNWGAAVFVFAGMRQGVAAVG